MDNKTTSISRNSAAETTPVAGSKKGNGAGALTIDTTVEKPKRAAKSPLEAVARGYSRDDIALRAYFIAEKRRADGLPGDQEQDWLEAERQLLEENQIISSPKTKKTRR